MRHETSIWRVHDVRKESDIKFMSAASTDPQTRPLRIPERSSLQGYTMRSDGVGRLRAEGRPMTDRPRPCPHASIDRNVEWVETDASGHQHNSSVMRWVESAEAELF